MSTNEESLEIHNVKDKLENKKDLTDNVNPTKTGDQTNRVRLINNIVVNKNKQLILKYGPNKEKNGHGETVSQFIMENNALFDIPSEISHFPFITYLNLSTNRISTLIDLPVNLQSINLASNRFSVIPKEIFALPYLKKLNMKNNNILKLPEEIVQLQNLSVLILDGNRVSETLQLQNMKSLTHFSATKNQISEVVLPPSLKYVNLSGNQITNITSLCSLRCLKTLDVSKNDINNIPEAIRALNKLKDFNISENRLVAVPQGLFALKKLCVLNLRDNAICLLPKRLSKRTKFLFQKHMCFNLTNLDLSYNKIDVLPKFITELTNLRFISLASNCLGLIRGSMKNMKSLRFLDISLNKGVKALTYPVINVESLVVVRAAECAISRISDGISKLGNLKVLILRSNEISKLPDSIGELKSLKVLDINQCDISGFNEHSSNIKRIEKLPDSITKLTQLKALNLAGNLLVELPSDIGNLSKLKKLNVNCGMLDSLPESIGKLEKLEYFSCKKCSNLVKLPESFKSLKTLRVLTLSKCNQPQLIDGVFECKALRVLRVNNIGLNDISNEITKIRSLRILDLSLNDLEKLPETFGNIDLEKDAYGLDKLKVINLKGNRINSLPQNIGNLKKIENFVLTNYTYTQENVREIFNMSLKCLKIKKFNSESFASDMKPMKSLQKLVILSRRLRYFPDILEELTGLKTLIIRNTHVKQIFSLEKLTLLEHIEIRNNCHLKSIPKGLENLINLIYLHIENSTMIKSLPENIGNLKSLKVLNIKKNGIRRLPSSIGDLRDLRELLAYCNYSLDALPYSLGNLKNLERLELGGNAIHGILPSFTHLAALRVCNICSNSISKLPDDFGNLSMLRNLSISFNTLYKLPASMEQLKNLTSFRANHICLTEIPDFFGNMKCLVDLMLSHNNISEIPDSICGLDKLKILYLHGNNLQTLPEAIGNMKSLELLLLKENKLIDLPNSMKRLRSLKRLDLSSNNFQKIPDVIYEIKSIKHLWLSKNAITDVGSGISALANLENFSLSFNRIELIPHSVAVIRTIKSFILEDNPIRTLGNDQGMGIVELTNIFSSKLKVTKRRQPISKTISKSSVYKTLDGYKLTWNREKLQNIRIAPIPKHKMSGDEIELLWDTKIATHITSKKDENTFKSYMLHIYGMEEGYRKWPMLPAYISLAKDLIEQILLILTTPENMTDYDKMRSHIESIAEGTEFCPDRQIGELRFSYFALVERNDPLASLNHFIENYIAISKEDVFDQIVTPDTPQNVHTHNYWRYQLRNDLGFDFEFTTVFGAIDEDPFPKNADGNILEAFYRKFSPRNIILALTKAINTNKERLCEALQTLSELQISDEMKKPMFVSETGDIYFAEAITYAFTMYYLKYLDILK